MDVAIVLIVILVLVLLFRGPQALPKLGESLGEAVRSVRRAARGEPEDGTPEGGGEGTPR